MTPADAITLETYGSLTEAQLAKAKLEAHGIPAMVDERWTYISPIIPSAVGGIRLLVPPSAAEEARRILAEREPAGAEVCPVCGSEDLEIRRGAKSRRACRECGHHWRA